MELALAIMMVLGIFIAIPAVIGFAIGGTYIMSDRRARRAERAEAIEAVAEALHEQPAEVHGEAVVKEPTRKPIQVAQH